MKRTRQEQQFGMPDVGIPAEVLFNPELTETQKVLFGFIRNLAHTEKGCWASNSYLSKFMNCGRQTITNGIAKLKEYNYIIVELHGLENGTQTRRIYINKMFPQIYSDYLQEVYKNINRPLLKNLYPPIKIFIDPYKNIYSKYDSKKDNKEDKENISYDFSKNGKIRPSQFNRFWKLYPKKIGKMDAQNKWNKICKLKEAPNWSEIKNALEAQMETTQWQKAKKFIPNPSTWLNQGRWEDDASAYNYEDNKNQEEQNQGTDMSYYYGDQELN